MALVGKAPQELHGLLEVDAIGRGTGLDGRHFLLQGVQGLQDELVFRHQDLRVPPWPG